MSKTKTTLSASDVTEIIKACTAAKISSFDWNGLKLNFGASGEATSPNTQFSTPLEYVPGPKDTRADDPESKDLAMSELMLTDPELYEERLLRENDAADRPIPNQ